MGKYLIVGGGLSGLLTTHLLAKKGFSVEGLEKSDSLGGRIMAEDQRFYSGETARLLESLLGDARNVFSHEEDSAKEVRKGEIVELNMDHLQGPQTYFVQAPFFALTPAFNSMTRSLAGEMGELYRLRKAVSKIRVQEGTAVCIDGEELAFDRLIWCAPLGELLKALGDQLEAKVKLSDKEQGASGLVLEVQSSEDWFGFRNSVCLPFRYKEHKLTALGSSREKGVARWLLFLDEELVDDREEVAKCVRALKREVTKAFPIPMAALIRDRVVYWPLITGEPVAQLKSLELAPGVFYAGPQARLPHVDPDVKNLDLVLRNVEAIDQLTAEWAVRPSISVPVEGVLEQSGSGAAV